MSHINVMSFCSVIFQFLFTIFGVKDFLPNNAVMKWLAKNVCSREIPDILCENVLFLFGGYDEQQMNRVCDD